MRIDAFNKVSQLYQQSKTSKVSKTNAVSKKDRVEISQMGKDYQIAKQAVAQASDIREDKVNDLKQRIASGTYNVSAEDLADKMIKRSFDTTI